MYSRIGIHTRDVRNKALLIESTPPLVEAAVELTGDLMVGGFPTVTVGTYTNAVPFKYDLFIDDILVLEGVALAAIEAREWAPEDEGLEAYIHEYVTGPGGVIYTTSAVVTIDPA